MDSDTEQALADRRGRILDLEDALRRIAEATEDEADENDLAQTIHEIASDALA